MKKTMKMMLGAAVAALGLTAFGEARMVAVHDRLDAVYPGQGWTVDSRDIIETQTNQRFGTVVTHPLGDERSNSPAVLSRTVKITGTKPELHLRVRSSGMNEVSDWVLSAKVNGDLVLNPTTINNPTTAQEYTISLDKYLNQTVKIELCNAAGGGAAWNCEYGYWDYIAVTTGKPADAEGAPIGVPSAIGDVMVVDISGGASATSYPVSYYSNIDMGYFNCPAYKTSKIALRKVKKGTYTVGNASNYADGTGWPATEVTVNQEYYIALTQITKCHWYYVMGGDYPSSDPGYALGNQVYNHLRSGQSGNEVSPSAPVSGDGFLGRLCQKACAGFDLSTELQWEIAARATSTAEYGTYVELGVAKEGSLETLGDFAWCPANNTKSTHTVGGKCPNLWGLYDATGNVWEWCRDRWNTADDRWNTEDARAIDVSKAEDFYDAGSSVYRVVRGAPWNDPRTTRYRPSFRIVGSPNELQPYYGARVCCMPAYVVTLDAQGGTGGTPSVMAIYDAVMPAATVPTKTGYTFAGYFDADGKQYYNADGTSAANWDKAANTTLTARWTVKSYTLTLDLAGGEGATSASVTYGQIPAALDPLPTKAGRKFLGFFTEADGKGTQVFDERGIAREPWTSDAGATLYAYWVNELWTSGTVPTSVDLRAVKPATVFRPETLTSSPKGWEANAETATILEAIGEGDPVVIVGTVSANATVWTPQTTGLFTLTHTTGAETFETAKFLVEGFTYTVAFDANGGTGDAMETQTLAYGAEGTAPSCSYVRADYVFAGWNTRKDGTGDAIAVGGAFSNLVTSPDETGTLYAMWEVDASKAVAYEVDVKEGGTPATEPIKVTKGWMDENLPDVDQTKPAEVKAALETTDPETGLKAWQEYVVGVKPGDKGAKIWIDSPQQKSADKIKVKMKELSPTKGSGFTVKYRLDTKLNGAEAATKGTLAASPDFDIDVSEGDPTGLYTINVVFVPDGKESSDEVVESVNTMGILKVPSPKALEIVAVPWNRLAPDENQAVLVADLVKTATLTPGDKLHVYDRAKKDYKSWSYDAASGWVALGTFKVTAAGLDQTVAPDQTEQTVARGSAVWLERQDASKPFYLYGQYSKDEVATKVEKNRHNLVASPKMTAFRLNDAGRFEGTIGANDQIIVPQGGNTPPKTYTYKAGQGWGYSKFDGQRFRFDTTDDVVPVGTGFWYISKGGSPTIKW